jgi:mono/diheme cytochrome c family protein
MARKILTASLVLAVSFIIVVGCKKETPQKAEEQQSAPAAQPTPMAESTPQAEAKTGEDLFKKYCAVCHPDGGNIVKPEMTLHSSSLKEHKITTAADIVKIMRNPNPGMTKFDETMISDQEAAEIAEYVLKNY